MSKLKLVESDGYYSLQFDEKPLYLSVFRGYRMQVSADAEGNYNHGSSEISLSHNLEVVVYDFDGEQRDVLTSAIIYGHIYTAVSAIDGFYEAILANTDLVSEWLEKSGEQFDIVSDLKVSPEKAASIIKIGHVELTDKVAVLSYTDQQNRDISFDTDMSILALVTNQGHIVFNSINVEELFGEKGVMKELSIVENAFIPLLASQAGVHHNSKVLLNAKRNNLRNIQHTGAKLDKSSIFSNQSNKLN